MRMPDESVEFSMDSWALDTNSFPSLSHSIAGKGLAVIPTLILNEAPALYCTTSKYSGGRSITGAPENKRKVCYILKGVMFCIINQVVQRCRTNKLTRNVNTSCWACNQRWIANRANCVFRKDPEFI